MKVQCDKAECSHNEDGECILTLLSLETDEMGQVVCIDDDSE